MSIVTQIKDYKYSSWCEYDGTVEPVFQICNTQTVLNRIPFNDFNGWVNDPLPDVANFLDNQFRATSSQAFRWSGLATDCQNRRRFQ